MLTDVELATGTEPASTGPSGPNSLQGSLHHSLFILTRPLLRRYHLLSSGYMEETEAQGCGHVSQIPRMYTAGPGFALKSDSSPFSMPLCSTASSTLEDYEQELCPQLRKSQGPWVWVSGVPELALWWPQRASCTQLAFQNLTQ